MSSWERRWTPDERLDIAEMLFELRPIRESIRARGDQLRVGEGEVCDSAIWTREKFFHHAERVACAGRHRGAQAFGVFPEVLEGRIVRERTCRHSDLLTRASGLSGLWSAASGEEAACLTEK